MPAMAHCLTASMLPNSSAFCNEIPAALRTRSNSNRNVQLLSVKRTCAGAISSSLNPSAAMKS